MITLCRLVFMATLAAACIVSESFSSNLRGHCGLTIDSQLTDLGMFAGDESIDWLEQFVSVSSDLSPAALHAIVQHAGDRPIAIIDKIL